MVLGCNQASSRFDFFRSPYLGTPEKVKSTAAQLVSVIESR